MKCSFCSVVFWLIGHHSPYYVCHTYGCTYEFSQLTPTMNCFDIYNHLILFYFVTYVTIFILKMLVLNPLKTHFK